MPSLHSITAAMLLFIPLVGIIGLLGWLILQGVKESFEAKHTRALLLTRPAEAEVLLYRPTHDLYSLGVLIGFPAGVAIIFWQVVPMLAIPFFAFAAWATPKFTQQWKFIRPWSKAPYIWLGAAGFQLAFDARAAWSDVRGARLVTVGSGRYRSTRLCLELENRDSALIGRWRGRGAKYDSLWLWGTTLPPGAFVCIEASSHAEMWADPATLLALVEQRIGAAKPAAPYQRR